MNNDWFQRYWFHIFLLFEPMLLSNKTMFYGVMLVQIFVFL